MNWYRNLSPTPRLWVTVAGIVAVVTLLPLATLLLPLAPLGVLYVIYLKQKRSTVPSDSLAEGSFVSPAKRCSRTVIHDLLTVISIVAIAGPLVWMNIMAISSADYAWDSLVDIAGGTLFTILIAAVTASPVAAGSLLTRTNQAWWLLGQFAGLMVISGGVFSILISESSTAALGFIYLPLAASAAALVGYAIDELVRRIIARRRNRQAINLK